MSYILIILAVLVLLNTYPLLVSQSLVFRTKETAMKSSVKMVESALSGPWARPWPRWRRPACPACW